MTGGHIINISSLRDMFSRCDIDNTSEIALGRTVVDIL